MTEIDAFLDDLDRLAATASVNDGDAFYGQLVPTAAAAIGADAVEYVSQQSGPGHAVRWAAARGQRVELLDAKRLELLRAEGVPRILSGLHDEAPIIACPVSGVAEAVGVLAFRLNDSGIHAERQLELATAVAEIAARFELRRAADRVSGAEERLSRVENALVRLHSQSDLKAVAREASDEGRRLAGCDRLTVLARSGVGWRLLSTSGVARVSRRSDAARRMASLVSAAMRWGEPLAVPALEGTDTPPPLAAEVDRYCDASGVRALRVFPCENVTDDSRTKQAARYALLAEWFDGAVDSEAAPLLEALARHVGVAAQRHSDTLGQRFGLGRTAIALLVATLLAGGAVLAMITPATLWVAVEGQFEPIDHARVFAPLDGVVEAVLVRQADRVEKDQPLVRLASVELRLQQEEVAEAIASTQAELAALETAKLRATLPGRRDEDADPTALASRVAAQRERLEHQHKRRKLLAEQETRLLVLSPIEGSVVSWRPEDYLADRPVRRGQRLMEIADDERWRIELEVPDHRSGHVLRASEAAEPLRVEYVVRSDPSQTHAGTLASIAETTHVDAEGVPVVRVVVTPEDESGANPRSGLGVSAKIDCGEHSLAYVWLHEAIEAIRRRWF